LKSAYSLPALSFYPRPPCPNKNLSSWSRPIGALESRVAHDGSCFYNVGIVSSIHVLNRIMEDVSVRECGDSL